MYNDSERYMNQSLHSCETTNDTLQMLVKRINQYIT
jgi:hypothetical protein